MSEKRTAPYHHGNLRAALIDAALELLESRGLEGVSLRGLAAAAGVSRAAPYAHFSDKDALLAAVANRGFTGLAQEMERAMAAAEGARERFLATGRAYVRFALQHPNLFELMFTGGRGASRDEQRLLAAPAGPYSIFERTLREYVEARGRLLPDAALARITAWSCVHGLSLLILEKRLPGQAPDAMADKVTAFFADLLGAEPLDPSASRDGQAPPVEPPT